VADIYPPTVQRPALVRLVEALGCRDAALRRDECGDWRVVGKFGHIYALPGALDKLGCEGFQIYFRGSVEFEEPPKGSKAWAFAKQATSSATVANDGEGEGMMFLDRLPTADEAAIIRDKLGIPKKREISDAEAERLQAMGFSRSHVERAAVSPEVAPVDLSVSMPSGEQEEITGALPGPVTSSKSPTETSLRTQALPLPNVV
jgi:hypothetical protein